ncbi:MAG: FG-GAP repeat domain-containing protein, partial [Sphingomonadales bacterium]
MMKKLFVTTICFLQAVVFAQNWQSFTDSIPTLSSPRACDLNNDGIKDVVFGGGTDGVYSNNGIMAYNGANGALLWKRPARNEVFGSAIFKDITNDGIKDVFIVGRQAQLLAINGSNGQLIWDYFPYNVNPADSGLYNFYNPQFIADVSGDGVQDILVANGGDHAAPVWDTTRPPGHLMVVNSMNGQLLAKAVVPDSAETYCSALVADVQGNGTQWVLYGTGGETLGGSFWACPLSAVLNNTLAPSIVLMTDPQLGFVAPASLIKNASGQYDIIIQSYGGKVSKIKAANWSTVWSYDLPNTESSAEPVIGNFTGNFAPDVFLSLAKGTSSSYTDYYQVLLDGESGQEVFKDSIGLLQFASGNAIDLNNDGRDEAILSVNYMQSGAWKHRLEVFDFVAHTIQPMVGQQTGVNIGSTPLFTNVDNDNLLDLVYVVKKDSLNPMGWKGVYLNRVELSSVFPNAGLAWGSYLSTQNNGVYFNQTTNCGPGSILSNVAVTQPWCNGSSSGA